MSEASADEVQDCVVEVIEHGPYLVSGRFTLIDKDGASYQVVKKTIALCRCGQSDNKPFCDGTHKECGFVGHSLAR